MAAILLFLVNANHCQPTSSEECFSFINSGEIAALIMPMWYLRRNASYMPDLEGDIYIRPMPVAQTVFIGFHKVYSITNIELIGLKKLYPAGKHPFPECAEDQWKVYFTMRRLFCQVNFRMSPFSGI